MKLTSTDAAEAASPIPTQDAHDIQSSTVSERSLSTNSLDLLDLAESHLSGSRESGSEVDRELPSYSIPEPDVEVNIGLVEICDVSCDKASDKASDGCSDTSASKPLISQSPRSYPEDRVIYMNTNPDGGTPHLGTRSSLSVHSYRCTPRDGCVSESSYDYIASTGHYTQDSSHIEHDIFHELQITTPDSELYNVDTDTFRHKRCLVEVRWNIHRIQTRDIRAIQLPGLWRHPKTITHTNNNSRVIFKRQYTRKCTHVDVTRTPLVLTTMRKSSKVYASMIQWDTEEHHFSEVGPQLVIPVNYPGWFQHIDDHSSISVHSLPTIGDVASAELSEFLVHSPITAYRYAKRSDEGDKLYSKVDLAAGEVLTTKSVLTEWLSEESVNKGCFCVRNKRKADVSYLKVRDSTSRRLLLPFETSGGFSAIGQRGGETRSDASYQLTDIARWVQLPVKLKLVCGELPNGLEKYTGLFRLEQLSFETSLYGCTVNEQDGERQMIEFPVSTELEFVSCKNWSDVKTTEEVKSSLHQADENMDEFITSMKILQDVEPDDELGKSNIQVRKLGRSLPPTPLLPRCAKRKRLRGLTWVKNLLAKYQKVRRIHDGVASESSDYEVIPFYLRTVNNQELDASNARLCQALEKINFAQYNQGYATSEKDSAPTSTLPNTPPPLPMFKTLTKTKSDSAHDEDGYLLPLEFRDARKICTPQSPHSGTNALSSGCQSTHLETCSSATFTRELEICGSLNKSTETLLAPPSSGTMRTCINSITETDYTTAKFDKQRLDAFLSDSLHELCRRQSRELITNPEELKQKMCHSCSHTIHCDSVPAIESQTDVTSYLDKIFECDDEEKCQSSHSSSTTTGIQTNYRRSMSVPESMLPRLDHIHRGSHQCLECGYQTLDSGIWLSPHSVRDSGTYRSTSECSWVPPENVEPLTVEEVGLSLRYIGMKDYIVTRFYEEQIDGKQLAELTNQLLLEGFPELNALDRKKLCDFVTGWRPKKWGIIAME